MLATRDVRLARQTVRELYARGQVERAQAVEAILARALATNESQPPEHLTLGQAARALGVSLHTVQRWVATGELPVDRPDGRPRIHRTVLQVHLEKLRRHQQRQPAASNDEQAAARRQHDLVVAGLPSDKVARLEALIDKVQDGKRLRPDERAELRALEAEVAALAGRRLAELTDRDQRGSTGP